jgi:peptidoglycan/xylan/chitin deacetylase (PgdA/CDA1 family)
MLTLLHHFAAAHLQHQSKSKPRTMSRTLILGTALQAITRSGLARLLAPVWGGAGVIFCLHHVCPPGPASTFAPNSNLEITPDFLRALIRHVKALGYDLVSLDEALLRLQKLSPRRFAVFTLDDGYKDNLRHALPAFEAEACPFTIYVAPKIADGTCLLWWRGLELVIDKASSLAITSPALAFTGDTSTPLAKMAAWKHLAPRLQAMPEHKQRHWMAKVADQYTVDLKAYCRAVAMNWDDLRLLAANPLATIGAHTLDHFNLRKLDETEARHEIAQSGRRISAELGRPVRHFAYPYGNKDAAGPREFRLAREAGYASAVVTRLGPLVAAHASHLHALPRLMISGRFQNTAAITALLSGVPSRLSNRLSGLNVG